jgi:hypothetical protein
MILPLSLLACPVGRYRNVGDVTGGLERANGGAVSEARVRRVREFPTSETLHQGLGRNGELTCRGLLCLRPNAGVSSESETDDVISGVGRDSNHPRPFVRPRMKWRDGLVRSHGLLEAQQGESWPVGLLWLMFVVRLAWEAGWIFILIWVPLIMVPDTNKR